MSNPQRPRGRDYRRTQQNKRKHKVLQRYIEQAKETAEVYGGLMPQAACESDDPQLAAYYRSVRYEVIRILDIPRRHVGISANTTKLSCRCVSCTHPLRYKTHGPPISFFKHDHTPHGYREQLEWAREEQAWRDEEDGILQELFGWMDENLLDWPRQLPVIEYQGDW